MNKYLLIPLFLITTCLCAAQDTVLPEKPKAYKQPGAQEIENTPAVVTKRDPEAKVTFQDLTIEEKLAQTIVIAVDVDTADRYKDAIKKGLVGGVLIQWGNYSLQETKGLIDKLQGWAAESPAKIPLLISIDYEGGTVYTPVTLGFQYLPTNMMLAAAKNVGDTITLFYIVAKELKSVGVHINFAPVIDVNINPANPIIGVRSFGANTQVVSEMGIALITGLQSAGIMAVAKHFPGHGETVLDSHLALPHLAGSEEDFRTIHLPPFKKAIENNVMGIMTAHIVYDFIDPENPATFSKKILKDLLRDELKFKGIIISDSLDMAGASKGSTIVTAAAKSLSCGVDMILTSKRNPSLTHAQLMEQIGKNVPLERVEDAAEKIFNLKQSLGLFDDPEHKEDIRSSTDAFNFFAGKITREAVTIVRQEPNVLPYTKEQAIPEDKPKLCSVFFSPSRFADQLPVVNAPFMEKGWQVEHYNAHMKPNQSDIKRAKKCMEDANLVLIGSLQWADKPISSQRKAIQELLKTDKDIIFLSLMSPYDIKFYPEAKNVIALYGVNKLSVRATADIILGNIEAKGKLPIKL